MSKDIYPEARKDGLVTSKVGDETVMYDTENNKALCLDQLTTVVWEACDGKTNMIEILDNVRSAGHQDASEDVVEMAVIQLHEENLLFDATNIKNMNGKIIARRKLLKALLRSAATIPAISVISIQPAVAQGSGLKNGSNCEFSYECASNCCNKQSGVCSNPTPNCAVP